MYKEGFLLIYTSEKKNFELNNLIGNISKIYSEDTILGIGVSMKYNSLEKLYYAINESLFSYYYSMINDRKTSYYDELGLYQILLPNIKNKWIEKFYNSRIKKIIDYDLKNKTGLIDTIDAFVNNNGNYKKTAYETSQHINTVRYRIDKVYSLIGQGKHFEILAIIMFFHKIVLFDEENNLF
jgi:sugar diacid utilization regulator